MDLTALALQAPCIASNSVIIGDGSGLSIANIGSFSFTSLLTPLFFFNVLHVPAMSKNLILVSTLCADNPINVLFSHSFFQMLDRHTRVTLVHEHLRDDVYYWSKSVPLQSSAIALSSLTQSSLVAISLWQSRLGHPSLPNFQKFLSVLTISFPKEHFCSFSYNFCILIKSTSYLLLNQASPLPLNLMSSFLMCGPHSFPLLMVFIITLLFFENYTKYIWFYPLRCKLDVHATFVAFKKLVENYFTTTIKTLYIDNGGKFLALRSFLVSHGITHLTTPPHTPEHNGYSEPEKGILLKRVSLSCIRPPFL